MSFICQSADGQVHDLTAAVAERLPAGPALAAWLASAPPRDRLAPWDRPGIAASYRRLAAWATARELDTVADMVTAAADSDPSAGLTDDGAPRRVTAAAAAEVGLALTLSQTGATRRAELALSLRHRLPATFAALDEGRIDENRARIMADATALLDDEEVVSAVEAKVLPRAPELTTTQLRDAVRHAVMTADPRGADERREKSQRRAKLTLYPDDHGTATLTATGLPGVHAAAIMARVTALAQAMKAAGAGGGIDFLRTQIFAGLLLGTQPFIPPPPDAPPDDPPPPDNAPPDPRDSGTPPDDPPPPDNAPPGSRDSGTPPGNPAHAAPPLREASPAPPPPSGGTGPAPPQPDDRPAPTGLQAAPGQPTDPLVPMGPADPEAATWRGIPPPGDADAPPEDPADRLSGPPGPAHLRRPGDADDDARGPLPAWPPIPATIHQTPPALGPRGTGMGSRDTGPPDRGTGPDGTGSQSAKPPDTGPPGWDDGWDDGWVMWRGYDTGTRLPPAKRLDLTITWPGLLGASTTAARIGRLGPVTAAQGQLLALMAAHDPASAWRVVVVGGDGRAIAVERVRRRFPAAWRDRPPGVIGRVTVTISTAEASQPLPAGTQRTGIRAAVLATARRASARVAASIRSSSAATVEPAAAGAGGSGCDHGTATPAYRPPVSMREVVEARDRTCRHPGCRQPAWHADLDHTVPYEYGGLTCPCNLAARCRTHHQVKQEPGWQLAQPRPGDLELTTPARRIYRTRPETYPA